MMIFSHQTKGAIAQVLSIITPDAGANFVYKHLGVLQVPPFLPLLDSAPPEALKTMLSEMLIRNRNRVLHASAPVKGVFTSGVEDLERWALHDGWIVENDTLVRVTPAAEEATGIRDKFLQDIQSSGLDADKAIESAVENSSKSFVATPPDFNDSTTKVRMALETVARRAASATAKKERADYPDESDSWGKALAFLRSAGVIEKKEEEILARVYTFISPGAHIPKGVTAEEWARLARTFVLSSAYFLLRKYVAS